MAQTDTIKRYLTVAETADYLGISRWTIYRMLKDGLIPHTSFSKRVKRFDREKIDQWLLDRTTGGKT